MQLFFKFGAEIIQKDTGIFINDKEKVDVVGVNGAMETTHFKIILKNPELDSGLP